MRKLFGLAVPEGAISTVICPILGPGRSMALYRGSLTEGECHVDEDFITSRASVNSDFWDYIDAKEQEGKLGRKSGEVYRFKLSVKFLDSQGNAALVDPATGNETFKTLDDYEFYRSAKKQTSPGTATKSGNKTVRSSARSAAKAISAIAAAHAAPMNKLIDLVGDSLRSERERADSASRALARVLDSNEKPPETDWVATSKGIVDLVKTVKTTFLN